VENGRGLGIETAGWARVITTSVAMPQSGDGLLQVHSGSP